MDTPLPWMIYGVNGYTGRYCALEAISRGLKPIIAGRDEKRVAETAAEISLPYRVFSLAAAEHCQRELREVRAVLNCAGPFSATARPMLEACRATGTHYLDVTGEIAVFEYVHQLTDVWRQAGIVALPGVGFDVVPTDCMAAMLKEAMPDAAALRLAFRSRKGKLSPGTAKTMIEGFAQGCTVRKDGRLEQRAFGSLSEVFPYPSGSCLSVIIPWGDVSTAFYSTGIPNIEVYTAVPGVKADDLGRMGTIMKFLKWSWTQRLVKKFVEYTVTGPSEAERNADESELYGDVTDASGRRLSMTMVTPNGYSLTFLSAISSLERVLAGEVEPGAQTPSLAFGCDFVLDLPGVHCTEPA